MAVRPFPECHRHPHDLGRDARGPRPQRRPRPDGPGGDPAGLALPRCGASTPTMGRSSSTTILPLLPGVCDSVHPRPAVQEGRQRAHRAKELDPRPQARRLLAMRHAGGRGWHSTTCIGTSSASSRTCFCPRSNCSARSGSARACAAATIPPVPPSSGSRPVPRPIREPWPPSCACAISSTPSPFPRRSTARSSGSSPSPRRRGPPPSPGRQRHLPGHRACPADAPPGPPPWGQGLHLRQSPTPASTDSSWVTS